MSTIVPGKAEDIAGVLLAGGKSRRLGTDKRFVELGEVSLLRRALSVMEQVFTEILISVAEETPEVSRLGHRIITDRLPHCASLGGLYTGISCADQPRVFLAACDMPFLSAELIRFMASFDPQADVVMANLSHGIQPVHAVYSKRCLPHLEAMAKAGTLKLQDVAVIQQLSVRLIGEDELRRIDPELLSFLNINTAADLEFARKVLSGKGGAQRRG